MTPEEIASLAREYAEEMIKGKPSEELPNCLKNSMMAMNTEYIAEVFQWLTRRFCLVEKETVSKLLKEHRKENSGTDKGSREWFFYNGRLDLLKSLFPDLGKEVEG